jgi:hypothetical protein
MPAKLRKVESKTKQIHYSMVIYILFCIFALDEKVIVAIHGHTCQPVAGCRCRHTPRGPAEG